MIRIFTLICVLFFLGVHHLDSVHGALGPGESLGLGFYSSIHNNIDTTVNTLRKKELQKYTTFRGFGGHCRPPIPAIDREPMDEAILIEVTRGITVGLIDIFAKNNTAIDSDSLNNLSSCFSETYRRMTDEAKKDEDSLSQMGIIGLYSDGDTSNSDYDIIADIEKIDSILFAEKLDYAGKANTTKLSFASLARGEGIPNIFDGITGRDSNKVIDSTSSMVQDTPIETLGIGTVCSVQGGLYTGSVSVANMIDSNFIADLGDILNNYNPGLQDTKSHTYGNTAPKKSTETSSANTDNTSDFFDSRPCQGNFCIKVRSIPGGGNMFAGGRTYSIEELLDAHSKIMEPIANSNLSAQKHQKNSYQLPFLNITLRNKVSGGLVFIEDRPQGEQQFKEEYTQEMHDQEFDYLQKCAYVSAGLPGDKDRANIPYGVGYQFRTSSDADNTQPYKKPLGVFDPTETSIGQNCMQIALGKPREEYYAGLNTDLTELEVFTSALIQQISTALLTDKKLDTLRSK